MFCDWTYHWFSIDFIRWRLGTPSTNTCFRNLLPRCAFFSSASFWRHQNVFGGFAYRTPGNSQFCLQVTEEMYYMWIANIFISAIWTFDLQRSRKKVSVHEKRCGILGFWFKQEFIHNKIKIQWIVMCSLASFQLIGSEVMMTDNATDISWHPPPPSPHPSPTTPPKKKEKRRKEVEEVCFAKSEKASSFKLKNGENPWA